MTDRYIDTRDLAESIPDGPYKARIVAAAALGAEDEAIKQIVDNVLAESEAQELAERWREEFGGGAYLDTAETDTREPGVSDDDALARIQARLRKLARQINERDEDDPELDELRAEYKRLQRKLREFGDIPEENLTEQAVDAIMADFTPKLDGEYAPVDLSEDDDEQPTQEDRGSFFSTDDLLRIAAQEDARPGEDEELHAALLEHERRDRLGEDEELSQVSDEELWSAYTEAWGIENEEGR